MGAGGTFPKQTEGPAPLLGGVSQWPGAGIGEGQQLLNCGIQFHVLLFLKYTRHFSKGKRNQAIFIATMQKEHLGESLS